MNTFVNAIKNAKTTTTNGMAARVSSGDSLVDLYSKIGASRGKNIIPDFIAAFAQDRDLALRIVAWARDVRGGAGERQIFRDVLSYLEKNDSEAAIALMAKVPELGRFDDLLVFKTDVVKSKAFTLLGDALRAGNGLAAKWTPRKGEVARELREFFGMTPKVYRKTLVGLTNVVETQMCSGDWDTINYSHVPSLAHSRYKKAFGRHGTTYADYVTRLVKGEAGVKVNAGAVFPYDVLKGRIGFSVKTWSETELNLIQMQWEALPNFIGNAKVLAMVDVSASMTWVQLSPSLQPLDVAVSLGLYFADKNTGPFKNTFLTFSSTPQLMHLKGNINQKIDQMVHSNVGGSTNVEAAFELILRTAIKGKVAKSEMPETIVILSDMQFDACVHGNKNATEFKMIKDQYKAAGYDLPKVVFWNLNAHANTPVKFDKEGTALVSGFSPAVAASILGADPDAFTPEAIMLKAIMKDRYKVL